MKSIANIINIMYIIYTGGATMKVKKILLELTEEQHKEIKTKAAQAGMTMKAFILLKIRS